MHHRAVVEKYYFVKLAGYVRLGQGYNSHNRSLYGSAGEPRITVPMPERVFR
jgi:hypothetical protein